MRFQPFLRARSIAASNRGCFLAAEIANHVPHSAVRFCRHRPHRWAAANHLYRPLCKRHQPLARNRRAYQYH